MTVSGGYGSNVSVATGTNGYFSISITPTNVGGPFIIGYSVVSTYGNLSVNQNSLTVTAPIVVPTDKVLEGTVIAGQTGIMPNMAIRNPNGIGVGRSSALQFWTGGGTTVFLKPQKGYYDGVDTWTTYTDSNLLPSNIKSGVTVFGVNGTYSGTVPVHGTQTWSTAGTYSFTVPDGVYTIMAIMTGGGGGGGGEGGGYHGGGGGAGGFGVIQISVTPGQVLSVVVGKGGALGQGYLSGPGWWTYPLPGQAGGSTSVGSYTVGGGNGGPSDNEQYYCTPPGWGGAGLGYGQNGAPGAWENMGGTWGNNVGIWYGAGGTGIGGGSGGQGSYGSGQDGRVVLQW